MDAVCSTYASQWRSAKKYFLPRLKYELSWPGVSWSCSCCRGTVQCMTYFFMLAKAVSLLLGTDKLVINFLRSLCKKMSKPLLRALCKVESSIHGRGSSVTFPHKKKLADSTELRKLRSSCAERGLNTEFPASINLMFDYHCERISR